MHNFCIYLLTYIVFVRNDLWAISESAPTSQDAHEDAVEHGHPACPSEPSSADDLRIDDSTLSSQVNGSVLIGDPASVSIASDSARTSCANDRKLVLFVSGDLSLMRHIASIATGSANVLGQTKKARRSKIFTPSEHLTLRYVSLLQVLALVTHSEASLLEDFAGVNGRLRTRMQVQKISIDISGAFQRTKSR